MFKKAVQQGRSEREPEAYSYSYVEGLSDARTQLLGQNARSTRAGGRAETCFFNTLFLKCNSDGDAAGM